jgi:recombination protein RecA
MGKKKTLSIEESIAKSFGDDVLISGHLVADRKKTVIPVSPKLDLILGGGIPEGSFVIFTGQPKLGKTTLALDFASTCQQTQYNGELCPQGREVYYYNIEGRLKSRDLQGIPNLNLDKFHIIESKPGKILNAEEYLQIGEMLINNKPESIHIFDSFSALCTEAEMTKSMNEMQRADGPKLLAKFCRKISNVVVVNKNIIIGVTHLMGNVTGYGKAFKEKSGQSIAYQVDAKLWAITMSSWKDKNEYQIGQQTEWECITSAIGPPGKKTTGYIRYGEGIDKVYELAVLAVDLGLIQQSGAWYKFVFINSEDPPSVQGLENIKSKLLENPEWLTQLQDKIQKLL